MDASEKLPGVGAERLAVVLAGRREGKTTRLIEWALQGRPLDAWPNWNRLILVATRRECENAILDFEWADRLLRERGGPALAKIVLSADRDDYALRTRLRLRSDITVAMDNVEGWLHAQLGFIPAVMSMTGHIYDPKEGI